MVDVFPEIMTLDFPTNLNLITNHNAQRKLK